MALLRFYAGGDAILAWYQSFSDPGARMFRIAQYQDNAVMIWLLGIIGVALVLDVIINDLTPETITVGKWGFTLRWQKAFEHRHLLFVMIAVSYAAHPFLSNAAGRVVEGAAFLYWNALQAIILAFFDVKLRTRGIKWQRACA
jgi:hypothetical protein